MQVRAQRRVEWQHKHVVPARLQVCRQPDIALACATSPTFGSMVLELSSMFAMLIYGLIAWAIERIVWLIFYRPSNGPVVATTQTTTSEHHTNP